jgi:hypothetical protein
MPEEKEGYYSGIDAFEYGINFSRDGSDYNPSYQIQVDWRDIFNDLQRRKVDEFVVVVTGKVYKGRSKISGVSGVTDLKSLQAEIKKYGATRVNNEELAMRLLPMNEEASHITFISIQPLN